jgi:tRNA-dihydrouridine synthase
MDRQQGLQLADKYKLDGIMIGRGVFHDPFVFAEQSPWPQTTAAKRQLLYKKHVELFAKTWKNRERPVQTLNKFCKIYINGFEGAKELREQLMRSGTPNELIDILKNPAMQGS